MPAVLPLALLSRSPRIGSLALSLLLVTAPGSAQAQLAHEFIEPVPEEDLEIGATTPDGRMPAAVRTPSGVIRAPSLADQDQLQLAYGGNATPDSIDATYRIDRDTTRPERVRYDDPFTPAVTPFKRLYAFDTVDPDLELAVGDKALRAVRIGGVPESFEDHFFGDLLVDVAAKVPVRIPTVGPGTRLLAVRVDPPVSLEIVRDGADNFFVIGQERRRVRLIVELAASRAVFGSEFPEVSYERLAPWVSPLPKQARTAVNQVLDHLRLSQALPAREALSRLVAHFRSFAPSQDLPRASGGAALYRELALGRKGVCRHRAYGFVLTALGLGIPARFVRNEAHAWVEVGDGAIWRRIDLGGAAGRFDVETRSGAPPHAVPPDPYTWPEGAESGLLRAAPQTGTPGGGDGSTPSGALTPRGPASGQAESAAPSSSAFDGARSALPDPETPPSTIDLQASPVESRRGSPLRVTGRVTSNGAPCPNTRVDISLIGPRGETRVGSVPTDHQGRFDSQLTVPFEVDVGDYRLRARTPGTGSCGASR